MVTNEARISGITAEQIIASILAAVPVPPAAGEEFYEK